MAFPSGKAKRSLSKAFAMAVVTAARLKEKAEGIHATSLAGDIQRKEIMVFPTDIADALDLWASVRTLPGIGQYAKDQLDDQTLNLGTEFTAMVAACEGVRDWITANFPNQGGFLLERSFDANGRMVLGTLSTAQTAGLRTQLDALIAAID